MALMRLVDPDNPCAIGTGSQPARSRIAQDPPVGLHKGRVLTSICPPALAGDHKNATQSRLKRLPDEPVEPGMGTLGGHSVEIDAGIWRAFSAAEALGRSTVEPRLGAANRGWGRLATAH